MTGATDLLAPAGAVMVSLGAVLLSGERVTDGLLGVMRACAAVLLWVGVWHLGLDMVLAQEGTPEVFGVATPALVTAGLALLGWLAAACLFWLLPGGMGGHVVSAVSAGWAAGLIFPGLGQGGQWPPSSVALALAVLCLALALGPIDRRAAARRARHASPGRTGTKGNK